MVVKVKAFLLAVVGLFFFATSAAAPSNGAVSRSELLGIRAAVAPSGLTRIAASALPYVLAKIEPIVLPDVVVNGALSTKITLKMSNAKIWMSA